MSVKLTYERCERTIEQLYNEMEDHYLLVDPNGTQGQLAIRSNYRVGPKGDKTVREIFANLYLQMTLVVYKEIAPTSKLVKAIDAVGKKIECKHIECIKIFDDGSYTLYTSWDDDIVDGEDYNEEIEVDV